MTILTIQYRHILANHYFVWSFKGFKGFNVHKGNYICTL